MEYYLMLKEKREKLLQRIKERPISTVVKKFENGEAVMNGNKVLSFKSNENSGMKRTELLFDDNNKLHGECWVNGKKYSFEHGKKL